MIASVAGRVAAVTDDGVVVEVGGVGLALACTPAVRAGLRVGEEARLSTTLVVREDSLTLYGFAGDDQRVVFETLQGVTGVGPRLAQAVLGVLSPDDLRRAVLAEDLTTLTRVPGVGRKGAQRLVLELKDRLGVPLGGAGPAPPTVVAGTAGGDWRQQVRSGLVGLGWSAREAEEALIAVEPLAGGQPEPDVATLLRAALGAVRRPA